MNNKTPILWVLFFWTIISAAIGFWIHNHLEGNALRVPEALKCTLASFAAGSVLVASLVHIYQSDHNSRDIEWKKVDKAMELVARWDSEPYMKARDFVRQSKGTRDNWSANQLRSAINGDPELSRSIRLTVNYWIDIRQAWVTEWASQHVILTSLQQTFFEFHKALEKWIEEEPEHVQKDLTDLHTRWRSVKR